MTTLEQQYQWSLALERDRRPAPKAAPAVSTPVTGAESSLVDAKKILDRTTTGLAGSLAGSPIAFLIVLVRALASTQALSSTPLGAIRYTARTIQEAAPNPMEGKPLTLTPKMAWIIVVLVGGILFMGVTVFLVFNLWPMLAGLAAIQEVADFPVVKDLIHLFSPTK